MFLHPFFIHLSVAFLTTFALCELVRTKKLLKWEPWFFIKGFLAITGWLASIGAAFPIQIIKSQLATDVKTASVIELLSMFSLLTVAVFAFPALAYFVEWLGRTLGAVRLHTWRGSGWTRIHHMAQWILSAHWIVTFSLIGLFAITVSGALGDSLVYGKDANFIISSVYRFFAL